MDENDAHKPSLFATEQAGFSVNSAEQINSYVSNPGLAAPSLAVGMVPTIETSTQRSGRFSTSSHSAITLASMPSAKRTKKPLVIVAIFVAFIAIASTVVMMLLSNKKADPDDLKGRYASLRALVQEGPEQLRGEYKRIANSLQMEPTTDETGIVVSDNKDPEQAATWFIFVIDQGILSQEDKNAYFAQLQEKCDKLLELAVPDGEIKQEIAQYIHAIDIIANSSNLDYISNKLASIYINDGAESAAEYIQNKIPRIDRNDRLYGTSVGRTADAVNRYLNAEIDIIRVYSRTGCVNGYVLLTNCDKVDIHNTTIKVARKEQNIAATMISSSRNSLISLFREYTEALTFKIEGANE